MAIEETLIEANSWIYSRFDKNYTSEVEEEIKSSLIKEISPKVDTAEKEVIVRCYSKSALSFLFDEYFTNNYLTYMKKELNGAPSEFVNKIKPDMDFIKNLDEISVFSNENIESEFTKTFKTLDDFKSLSLIVSSLPLGSKINCSQFYGEGNLYNAMATVVIKQMQAYSKLINEEIKRLAEKHCPIIANAMLGDLYQGK